ncbi:MAG: polysaccharide deacetylase family protein [Salinirussus sp.]
METPPEPLRREVSTYLSWAADAEGERAIAARTFHLTAAYEPADFAALSDRLSAADATGSFSILARDLDEQAEAVADLAADGHEIALHGLRHATYSGVDYDDAHDELSTAMDAIEDATGIQPEGFHVPFMGASAGTVRAADELGIEWLLGRPDGGTSHDLTVLDPVAPWDTRLLEDGQEPAAAFERLNRPPGTDEAFLMHPNVQEFYDGSAAFDDWLASRSPGAVIDALSGTDEPLVLDCVRPLRVV